MEASKREAELCKEKLREKENTNGAARIPASSVTFSEQKQLKPGQKNCLNDFVKMHTWKVIKVGMPNHQSFIRNPELVADMHRALGIADEKEQKAIEKAAFGWMTHRINQKRSNVRGAIYKKHYSE